MHGIPPPPPYIKHFSTDLRKSQEGSEQKWGGGVRTHPFPPWRRHWSSIESKFVMFESLFKDMERSIEACHETVVCLEGRTTALEKKLKDISDLSDDVSTLQQNLKHTMLKLNDMEQYSRRSNLRIFGLEVPDGESCTDAVVNFCNQKLAVDIDKADILRSHPLPFRSSSNSSAQESSKPVKQSIIVKFSNMDAKSLVLKNRKKLKNSGISVSEDLTNTNVMLLNRLRSNMSIKEAWSANGNIFCKVNGRKCRVNPFVDLDKLINN